MNLRRLILLLAVAALMALLSASTTMAGHSPGSASADLSNQGFGRLEAPSDGNWLIHHYDNRAGQVTGGPAFDDSGEVKFVGTVAGMGKVTVEQSAAWTWTSYALNGAARCALAYDSGNPVTLVRIHTHQGVSTENVSAALTLIPGSAVNDPGGTTEFPFAADGKGSNFAISDLDVGTHTFTGSFKVTQKDGDEISGIVEGGTNCEVEVFTTVNGHTPGVFDFTHSDTNNTVQTALEITAGTGEFAGATGTASIGFTYDTFEPHNLLGAYIVVNLD